MGRIALLVVLAAAAFAPAAEASTVKVSSTRYGDILVNGKGRVVYLFTKEKTAKSRCYGNCATAWPPVLTAGKPRAGKGATAKLVGTTKRKSGKRQVTYNGHPLYYYIADKRPGQITCQDVFEFGGTWLLVTVGGHPVR
jgi:predicted lipoprotein with Yx(FWY)xxD motif